MYKRCLECAESIKKIIGDFSPQTAVVLGSGLGGFTDAVDIRFTVDYKDLHGFPVSTVEGHSGKFMFGFYGGKPIAAASGRVHCYEGYTPAEAVMPVRVLKLLGVKNLILTNAAGGINADFMPGDIMIIRDHISFFADSPLKGANIDEFGTRFPDMSEVYDKKFINAAVNSAEELGINLKSGVYVQVKGPQYETPAEVDALRLLGADAVGMSTVIEAVAAKHAGMRVCGISAITNAALYGGNPISHNEVIENSKRCEKDFCRLLGGIIEKI